MKMRHHNNFGKPELNAFSYVLLRFSLLLLSVLLICQSTATAFAQEAPTSATAAIEGTVRNSVHGFVVDASVRLVQKGSTRQAETKSNASGAFRFSSLCAGDYIVTVDKQGLRGQTIEITGLSAGEQKHIEFTLGDLKAQAETFDATSSPHPSSLEPIEFVDTSAFAIAGLLSKSYESSPTQAQAVIQRFRRYAELEPRSGIAQYYYAMSFWKGKRLEDKRSSISIKSCARSTSPTLLRKEQKYASLFIRKSPLLQQSSKLRQIRSKISQDGNYYGKRSRQLTNTAGNRIRS